MAVEKKNFVYGVIAIENNSGQTVYIPFARIAYTVRNVISWVMSVEVAGFGMRVSRCMHHMSDVCSCYVLRILAVDTRLSGFVGMSVEVAQFGIRVSRCTHLLPDVCICHVLRIGVLRV